MIQNHDDYSAAAPPLPATPKASLAPHFRLLKPNEMVTRNDFVANDRKGFDPWEGPTGFRADAYVKPMYRRRAA